MLLPNIGMAKIHTFKGKFYTELPKDVVDALGVDEKTEIVFDRLPDGTYSVSVKEDRLEEGVLEKANSMQHRERKKDVFMKMLSEEEKKAYDILLGKKVLFEYVSNNERMTGVDRKFSKPPRKAQEKTPESDYMVTDDEDEARDITSKLMRDGRSEDYLGTKGFDKKFYLIKRSKLEAVERKILSSLAKEKKLRELCEDTGYEEGLCKAAVEILKERGDIVEPKREVYWAP